MKAYKQSAKQEMPSIKNAMVLSSITIAVMLCFSSVSMAQQTKSAPASRADLFGDDAEDLPKAEGDPDSASQKTAAQNPSSNGVGLKGFLQFEAARTVSDPQHWSKLLTRADVNSQGRLTDDIKWKLGARLDYDAVYSVNNYYPSDVAKNQRFNLMLRENYLDIGAGDWDFRLGRQHVVWGEMVGLYFADVVSARDMREFILPDFDVQRIPQWAARAEYFKDNFHAELLWIPIASYDEIGKPGAEFFPYQPVLPGFVPQYSTELRPRRTLRNSNYGVRLSSLSNGWDVSGFYYRSMDTTPTFYRQLVPGLTPTSIFEAKHDRIEQLGGTLAKDLGPFVLKSEAVYTHGRQFSVLRPSDPDGVVPQNTLDWVVGFDFSLANETRFNVQVFQRIFFAHDPDIIPAKHENGYSLYLSHALTNKWEAQVLWISSLNRTDSLLRPKLVWNFQNNWRASFGVDYFKGSPTGFFGQYNSRDRAYTEVRYSF